MASLAPGETGCLREGAYTEGLTIIRPRITLRSSPGERARLVGRLVIARDADGVTVENLDLDGANAEGLPSPTLNADDVTIRGNDITFSGATTTTCVLLGNAEYGSADRARVVGNRIHDCGTRHAHSTSGARGHGIYAESTTGTLIRDNVVYDNARRGLQLYPDAQKLLVENNVFDGNGQNVLFSGDGGTPANDNTVAHNVISNAATGYNVDSWYPAGTPAGKGNVVSENCLVGGAVDAADGGLSPPVGWQLGTGNRVADPGYSDRARADYRIAKDSPCASLIDEEAIPLTATALPGERARRSRAVRRRTVLRCRRKAASNAPVRGVGRCFRPSAAAR